MLDLLLRRTDETTLPPGPAEPSALQAARFGADPFGYLVAAARRHGDTFTLRLPGDPPRIVCSHPDDIRAIFALRPEDYRASEFSVPLALGDRSLLLLDGEQHAADRKLILPTLLGEQLDAYGALMREVTREGIARWPMGAPFPAHEAMRGITLSVITRCVFGIADDALVAEVHRLVEDWLDLALSPQVFFAGIALRTTRVRAMLDRATAASPVWRGPAPRWRVLPWQRIADTKAALMVLLHREVRRCRDGGAEGRTDVLAHLAAARFDDGSPMSDVHLVDELVTLLVGGHETTANALAWALAEILPRPDVVTRVREEIAATFPDGAIDPAGVHRLRYLEACIQESMRLQPIAVAVPRVLTRPLALRRCTAPAGTVAWACPYLTHRHPELWDEPDAFRPERFLEEAKPSASTFYPFGGGRRRCTGMSFASHEMRIVLAEVLSRTTLERPKGARSRPMMRGITMAPADGLPVVLRARS